MDNIHERQNLFSVWATEKELPTESDLGMFVHFSFASY